MKRIIIGLAALAAIVTLVIGVPIGLYLAGGSPWPSSMPTWDGIVGALTSPDDGTAFLAVLKIVGWIAWAVFAAMVLVELWAQLRGVPSPTIPTLGVPQRAAAGLVGAALMVLVSTPLTGTATAAAAPSSTATSSSATATVNAHPSSTTEDQSTQAVQASVKANAPTGPSYTVRGGDSLWSIAEEHLGDGARFPEIAELNYGTPQQDGGRLTSSHWVRPGWTLLLPGDSPVRTPDQVVVEPGDTLSAIASDELGDASLWPDLYQATQPITQPGGVHIVDPDLIQPGWTIAIPGQDEDTANTVPNGDTGRATAPAEPSKPQPSPESTPNQSADQGGDQEGDREGVAEPDPAETIAEANVDAASDDLADDEVFPVRTVTGVGSLLAAGVIGLIAMRRSQQQRRRKPGQPMLMPNEETAEVESELRATADPLSVEIVDVALRSLARHCSSEGYPLPVVRAARLTADQFDLYLAEPATLPEPWEGTQDRTVWTFHAADDSILEQGDLHEIPAPYPALVTVGNDDEDGHVFLDLEYLGALGLNGEPAQTRQVLAAIAVELATSKWADDLQVTIVGAYPELEDQLETGRVRYVPTSGRLLDELTRRAQEDRAQLLAAETADLNHARVTNTAPGAWTPEIVLLTSEVSQEQAAQLEQAVAQLPRVAIAAVTHGHVVGEWAITLNDDQTGTLEPIGLSLRPQVLDDATYAQILTMLATADADLYSGGRHEGWGDPEPTLADLPDTPAEQDHDQSERSNDDAEAEKVGLSATLKGADDAGVESADHEGPTDPGPVVEDVDVDGSGPSSPIAEAVPPSGKGKAEGHFEEGDPIGDVIALPQRTPQVLMLGPVEITGAHGTVEPSKVARLTELAAFLSTNPGCDHTAIDTAQWPGQRVSDNSRNTAMSKLRRWVGKTTDGDDFLPRYQSDRGYRFHSEVRSDWQQWQQLLPQGPREASTEALEEALSLVRGRPFDPVKARRYSWAEQLKQEMIQVIIDAVYELARRRLMAGQWQAAGSATLIGLSIEPGYEQLWRIRILAAHSAGYPRAVQEVVDRFLAVAEDWGGELEAETETLLEQLRNDEPVDRKALSGRNG